MSVLASAKTKFVGTGNVLAALLPGVQIEYSQPAKTIKRDLVYAGAVSGPVALAAMAGGASVKRTEELTLLLHVRVYKPNWTREQTDARAVEIGDVICSYIAANWTLGGLAELKKAAVSNVELTGWTDDEGSGSVLDIAIGLLSYLS